MTLQRARNTLYSLTSNIDACQEDIMQASRNVSCTMWEAQERLRHKDAQGCEDLTNSAETQLRTLMDLVGFQAERLMNFASELNQISETL